MRRALVLLLSAVLAGGTVAFAASLAHTSNDLGAGSAQVTACDDAVNHTLGTDASGNVVSVTMDMVAGTCAGGQLSLRLTKAGASVGSGGPQAVPTPSGGAENVSMTVSISSPQPKATDVDGVRTVILGP